MGVTFNERAEGEKQWWGRDVGGRGVKTVLLNTSPDKSRSVH